MWTVGGAFISKRLYPHSPVKSPKTLFGRFGTFAGALIPPTARLRRAAFRV